MLGGDVIDEAAVGAESPDAYVAGVALDGQVPLSDVSQDDASRIGAIRTRRTSVLRLLVPVRRLNVLPQPARLGLPLAADVARVPPEVEMHVGHVVAEADGRQLLSAEVTGHSNALRRLHCLLNRYDYSTATGYSMAYPPLTADVERVPPEVEMHMGHVVAEADGSQLLSAEVTGHSSALRRLHCLINSI